MKWPFVLTAKNPVLSKEQALIELPEEIYVGKVQMYLNDECSWDNYIILDKSKIPDNEFVVMYKRVKVLKMEYDKQLKEV